MGLELMIHTPIPPSVVSVRYSRLLCWRPAGSARSPSRCVEGPPRTIPRGVRSYTPLAGESSLSRRVEGGE